MPAKPVGPIFIVGYIHTGTSLLKTILKRNPAVWAVTGETHFFQDLGKIKTQFPDLGDPAVRRDYLLFLIKLAYLGNKRAMWRRDEWTLADFGLTDAYLDTILAAAADINTYEGLFARVNDQLTGFAGKDVWVEKTPEHVYYLNQLLRHIPEARVVELVRDPRATLASRKLRQTGDEWLDAKEAKESLEVDRQTNYDPLLDSLMWKEAVSAARETRRTKPHNIITVRYEDLVGRPNETLQRICTFTGLAYTGDMLEVGWVNSATQLKDGGAPTQPRTGVSTAAVEKWRKSLNDDEIYLCQKMLRAEMRELGYEPIATGFGAKAKAPLLLGATAVNLSRRLAGDRRSPERARDAFGRIQRRLLKNLGIQR